MHLLKKSQLKILKHAKERAGGYLEGEILILEIYSMIFKNIFGVHGRDQYSVLSKKQMFRLLTLRKFLFPHKPTYTLKVNFHPKP